MIIKWLVTGAIVFFVYRWFIQPKMVGTSQKENRKVEEREDSVEGEYIDYEEIKRPKQKVKQTRTNTKNSDYDQFFD